MTTIYNALILAVMVVGYELTYRLTGGEDPPADRLDAAIDWANSSWMNRFLAIVLIVAVISFLIGGNGDRAILQMEFGVSVDVNSKEVRNGC